MVLLYLLTIPLIFLNQLMDFHDNWYQYCVFRRYSTFMYVLISCGQRYQQGDCELVSWE
jgi:hypothetical protein